MLGKVAYYNDLRGFGFIEANNSERFFFHISNVENKESRHGEFVEFDENQPVKFDIQDFPPNNKYKTQAVNIFVL